MKALKSSVSVLSLLLLCGCAELSGTLQQLNDSLGGVNDALSGRSPAVRAASAEAINVRPAQICKDFRDNEARAKANYRGKTITVKGKASGTVKAVSPLDHGGFSLEVDGASIFYSASQDSELYDIQKGKTYTVRGEIFTINDYQLSSDDPCHIILRNGATLFK